MGNHYENEIRRNRISNLVEDEPEKYDYEHPKIIAEALDIDYDTVKNDIKFIKEQYRQLNKKYNLGGLARRHREKLDRMEQLQLEIQKMIKESSGKNKLDAINSEVNMMHNMFLLEENGINPLLERIAEKEEAAAEEAKEAEDELKN